MADPRQLALLKRNVREWNMWRNRSMRGWNIWRKAHSAAQVDLNKADLNGGDLREADLRGANLSEASLYGADLRKADLRKANLSESSLNGANLSGTNLSEANLRKASLYGADLRKANLSGADLYRADLRKANLSGANFDGALLTETLLPQTLYNENYIDGAFILRAGSTGTDLRRFISLKRAAPGPAPTPVPTVTPTSEPQSSHPSTTDWLSLVETVGIDLFVTAATLASIIQGLDVIERRWREHKVKSQQGTQTLQPTTQPAASPSHKTHVPDKEIIEILLVMDDGSHHSLRRWMSDPDELRAYIDAFSDLKSPVKPLQVVFRKREGRALVVNVAEGGKDNRQLNVILGYLEADPP